MASNDFDRVDMRILYRPQTNARDTTAEEISEHLETAPSTVAARTRNLEDEGVTRGYPSPGVWKDRLRPYVRRNRHWLLAVRTVGENTVPTGLGDDLRPAGRTGCFLVEGVDRCH